MQKCLQHERMQTLLLLNALAHADYCAATIVILAACEGTATVP